MRVVHLVIGGEVAGGQIVALQLARAARAGGHVPSFVSPTDGPFLERARSEGFAARVVPLGGALDGRALLRLVRALREDRAELLHTHAHFSLNVLGRVAGRLAGARVVAHMHIENAFRAGRGRAAQIRLDNLTARLCFAVVAVSESTRQALLRQGYPAGVVSTVHNGIEVGAPAEPVRLADGPVVLEVGRLARVKGQHLLIEAMAALDASLVLVGRDIEQDGAYATSLREQAARLGVAGKVVFAGPREDVPALLAGCDVFCLPSSIEGLPLVVLEAMAQARPVVATAVGGTPELVVDGETGLLVPPDDLPALVDALEGLLRDPERRNRLGAAGRARVLARFSSAEATRRVLELYERAA